MIQFQICPVLPTSLYRIFLAFTRVLTALRSSEARPRFCRPWYNGRSSKTYACRGGLQFSFRVVVCDVFMLVILERFIRMCPGFRVSMSHTLTNVSAPFRYARNNGVTLVRSFLL